MQSMDIVGWSFNVGLEKDITANIIAILIKIAYLFGEIKEEKMLDKIKLLIAKIVLHKYLPVQHIIKVWDGLKGYRTQICAVLWIAAYEFGKYKVGAFNDPAFTNQVLEWLGGMASVTLLEKFKGWTPLLEEGIETVKQKKA